MKIKIADIFLIIFLVVSIVIFAVILYIPKNQNGASKYYARVKINEKVVEEIYYQELKETVEYEFKGKISVVLVCADSSGVWIKSSGCPDHDCIRLGKYGDGDTRPILPLACLPNALIIEIVAQGDEVLG